MDALPIKGFRSHSTVNFIVFLLKPELQNKCTKVHLKQDYIDLILFLCPSVGLPSRGRQGWGSMDAIRLSG